MNILKLNLDIIATDANENSVDENNYSRYYEYNENLIANVSLVSNSGYRKIALSEITSPSICAIVADMPINVKVNGNEITNTQFLVLNTMISELEVANVSPQTAQVNISVWGVQ